MFADCALKNEALTVIVDISSDIQMLACHQWVCEKSLQPEADTVLGRVGECTHGTSLRTPPTRLSTAASDVA